MRLRTIFNRERTIEDRLRADRPEPSDRLVRSIVKSIPEHTGRRAGIRGLARVATTTGLLVVGLLALGGLGYAMTVGTNVFTIASSRVVGGGGVHTVVVNAANDQYGTTTTSSGGGGTTTTTTTTQTTTAPGSQSATVSPGSTGSVDVTTPTGTSVSVAWGAGAFGGTTVNVNVNPNPPVTSTSLIGDTNRLVSINVTNPSTGQPIHSLSAPLDVVFTNTPPGFVPAVSEDGVHFRALKKIDGPPLPAGMQDAYYVDSTGVHVLTLHVTIFAVLYKANVNVSESGRPLAAPGSGKFGDPTRIHVGPPALSFKASPTVTGKTVHFTFFVDEQAAMYFHVLSGGKSERIVVDRSAIRAHKLSGSNRRTLHLVVLRPGTIRMTLHVNGPAPDKVMVTAVDYDGHKVTQTANAG